MSIDTPSDRRAANPPDDVDASPLLGTWTNTNSATSQIAALSIEAGDGVPMLRALGASRPSYRDWGTIPIGQLYRGSPGVRQAAAFRAEYEIGPMRALLEANLSKGLLIIACLKTFHDASGRSDYFVREFFRRAGDGALPASVPAERARRPVTCDDDETAADPGPAGSPTLDPGLFLGRWMNTDSGTRGIREVRMSGRDGKSLMEIRSAGDPSDRGRREGVARVFAENAAGAVATQFHAAIDGISDRMIMHGWVKLGVLVIAVFRSPADPAASAPCFDREFFYQEGRH